MTDYDDGPEWDESYDFIIPTKNKKTGDAIWDNANFLEMKCLTTCRKYGYDDPPEYDSHMEIDSPEKTFSGEGSFSGWREALSVAVYEKFISEWQRDEMVKRYEEEYTG